jgi:hypothetical protein
MLSTWRDPSVSRLTFHKVLVVAPMNPLLRRSAEEALVRQLKNVQGVPSYTLIPDAEVSNNEQVRSAAESGGFDGIFIMRIAAVRREATWVPGLGAGPYYYAYGGWPAYDPGSYAFDTYVRVETNVYAMPDDRLVWASASRTVNPGSVGDLVTSTSKEIALAMRDQRLIR